MRRGALLQRAIKWTCDRLEDFAGNSQAFDEIVEAELALDGEGQIVGLRADVIGDVGAYSIYPCDGGARTGPGRSPLGAYRVPHYRGRVRAVATSKAPTGPYRGVGRPISTFVMERLIDMAAAKTGIDAWDIRLRNLVATAEFPYKVASGIVWDKSGFQEGLNAACAAIGYETLRSKQRAARAAGRWAGIGIACYAELTGIGSRISVAPGMPIQTGTETAILRIDGNGGVTAAFGIASHGQGLETTLAQIVAEHLGARFDDVRDRSAWRQRSGPGCDRHLCQPKPGPRRWRRHARRSSGAREGAQCGVVPSGSIGWCHLIAEDGRVIVAGTDRSITFREIAHAVYAEAAELPPEAREELAATQNLRSGVRHY